MAYAKIGLVLACIALGLLCRRLRAFPDGAALTLNRFVLYISLPALAFFHLHRLELPAAAGLSVFLPAAAPWIIFFSAVFFFGLLGRFLGWSRATVGALVLTGGLGNTSFVGFALVEALYGPAGIPTAVVIDQAGSFLVLATAGVIVASFCSGRAFSWRSVATKVLFFPPFLAMLLAFALRPWRFPTFVYELLERIGATLVPLALVAVGLQLEIFSAARLRQEARWLSWGLGFKLVLAPALVFWIYAFPLGQSGLPLRVTVAEAAMAPMITAGILAAEHGLRAELAALMVGSGILLSLVTVPLWAWWLG